LNCIYLQSSSAQNRETILTRRFEEAASLRLTRGSSWIWGDRAKSCLSEDPAPAAYSAVPKIRWNCRMT